MIELNRFSKAGYSRNLDDKPVLARPSGISVNRLPAQRSLCENSALCAQAMLYVRNA